MEKTYVVTSVNRSTNVAYLQLVLRVTSKKGEQVEFLATQDKRTKTADATDYVGKTYKVSDTFK